MKWKNNQNKTLNFPLNLGKKTLLNYNFRPISNILELIFFPNLVIQTSYYLGGSRWWIFIREFCIFRQKILQFFATPKIIAIYIQPIYANICSSSSPLDVSSLILKKWTHQIILDRGNIMIWYWLCFFYSDICHTDQY